MLNYTEEKFKVMGVSGRMQEVVKSIFTDETTGEAITTIRIQEVEKTPYVNSWHVA